MWSASQTQIWRHLFHVSNMNLEPSLMMSDFIIVYTSMPPAPQETMLPRPASLVPLFDTLCYLADKVFPGLITYPCRR